MPHTSGKRGYTFFFLSPSPSNIFPIIPCIFQKKSVSLHEDVAALGNLKASFHCARWHNLCSTKVELFKKEMNMDKKKNENFFLKLIEIKKEIRDCVQSGRDLKDVEKNYGIRFSKPL